ncbi:MAG: hypothetical protein NT129_04995 [Candidatus Aenigmarchaeota archaeon]|nr:hypothetical protein [Candidatus Aenigmarchaeota archaeon]
MRYTAEQEYVGKEQKKYQYTRQDDGGPVKIPLPEPERFVRIFTKHELLERAAGRG